MTLVLFICFSIFQTNGIFAENKVTNSNSKTQNVLLKKADLAYSSAKYAIAVDYINA